MADEKNAAGVDPREEGRSPLDVIEGVAFIGGDANVAQVGEVAPGVHRGSPRGIVLDTLKVLGALVVALVAAVASMFRGEDPGADAWVAVGTIVLAIVVALVAAVVSWRTRTWELAEDGLARARASSCARSAASPTSACTRSTCRPRCSNASWAW